MKKHSFWTALWGRVTFSVKNGSCEQFLNRCMEQNIPIQNIHNIAFELTASVPARYYKQLHKIARKSHCTLRCTKKQGICFTAYKLKGRYGLAVGAVLFILLPYLFENFVWNIVYYQIPQQQQVQIERILYQNGIYTGKKAKQDDLDTAQQQILLSMPEYAWASLNFVRGKIIVEAGTITNKPAIITGEVCDIVAACDGIITQMEVYEGFKQKTIGQSVAKGEVLVSGITQDRNMKVVESHSYARIIAKIQKDYVITQPLSYTENISTGTIKRYYKLQLPFAEIPLYYKIQPPENNYLQIRTEPVILLGFCIPASLYITEYVETAPKRIELTQEQAKSKALYLARQAMAEDLPEIQVEQEELEWQETENEVMLTMHINAYADIGKVTQQ